MPEDRDRVAFESAGSFPRLLLVCGAPRSGTTLLQALACSGSQTNPLMGEAVPIAHLASAYANSRDVQQLGETDDYFDDLADLKAFYQRAIATLLRRVWQRYDRPDCLVLKSPALTPQLPDLLELLPQAQAIISVRDPRDGAASLRAIGDRAPSPLENATDASISFEQRLALQPTERLAQHFCQHYAAILACRNASVWERLRFVRYEALVAQPEAAIAQLQAFTGLRLSYNPDRPWQRSAIDFQRLPDRYESWWSGQGYGDRISDASIGRYRELPPGEIRAIETACGEWMQRFGYPLDRPT